MKYCEQFDDEEIEKDDDEELDECPLCGGVEGDHPITCPNNDSPFALLIKEGFD